MACSTVIIVMVLNVFCFFTATLCAQNELFNRTISGETVSHAVTNGTGQTTEHTNTTAANTPISKRVNDTVTLGIGKLTFHSYNVSNRDNKIVGGHQAYEGQFPYQVSLRFRVGNEAFRGHYCGGSIISVRHVLTAAHCVKGKDISNIYVAAGSYDLLSTRLQERSVLLAAIHSGYNEETVENDIAIIMVDTDFIFNSLVSPISVASLQKLETGTSCVVSGWGLLYEEAEGIPRYLQMVSVPIFDSDECALIYTGSYTKMHGMICGGLDEGGIGPCKGDSGGPMVCNGLLSGVVSWGGGCAQAYNPAVFTDVGYFSRWIDANTNGLVDVVPVTAGVSRLHVQYWLTIFVVFVTCNLKN